MVMESKVWTHPPQRETLLVRVLVALHQHDGPPGGMFEAARIEVDAIAGTRDDTLDALGYWTRRRCVRRVGDDWEMTEGAETRRSN